MIAAPFTNGHGLFPVSPWSLVRSRARSHAGNKYWTGSSPVLTAAESATSGMGIMVSTDGILRRHGESRTVQMGSNSITFLLTGEETGGKYSLTEFVIAAPPAPGPPVHIHTSGDEAAFVLDGELELRLGDRTIRGTAGDVIYVPKGRSHNVSNLGPGTARILIVLSPPGFEGYWREMSELPLVGGKPDPRAILTLQEKYGMDTGGEVRQL
jgi:quercetin dioxygenase-like cupin family protein